MESGSTVPQREKAKAVIVTGMPALPGFPAIRLAHFGCKYLHARTSHTSRASAENAGAGVNAAALLFSSCGNEAHRKRDAQIDNIVGLSLDIRHWLILAKMDNNAHMIGPTASANNIVSHVIFYFVQQL